MRIKSYIISASYAERVILSPGQYFSGESYVLNRSFTTTAESIIGAAAPEIHSFGNASGELNLSVEQDFNDEAEAVATALEMIDFLEANQQGNLAFAVGSSARTWKAGVQRIDSKIQYIGHSVSSRVRLTLTYRFILGRLIG